MGEWIVVTVLKISTPDYVYRYLETKQHLPIPGYKLHEYPQLLKMPSSESSFQQDHAFSTLDERGSR